MFSLSVAPGAGAAPQAAGSLIFVPNIALDVLDNDELEEIVLLRDEDANLVWAVERRYVGANGEPVLNGDGTGLAAEPPAPSADGRPRYRFRADVPRHWIPYAPRMIAPSNGAEASGETYLRRARTDETATPDAPQHHTQIVAESWRLREEEIPRSGLRVRRLKRFARGSDGVGVPWVARSREAAPRLAAPGLAFDFLET
jgi:hypothetical protein